MRNLSISLLSGEIYYGFSNDTATNLQYVDSTCSLSVTVYIYDAARLLATYGAVLGVTTLVVVYGCSLIWRNEAERKLMFSDVVEIALNEDMFRISGNIQGRTQVHLSRTSLARRRLIPMSPVDGDVNDSHSSSAEGKEYTRRGEIISYMAPFMF